MRSLYLLLALLLIVPMWLAACGAPPGGNLDDDDDDATSDDDDSADGDGVDDDDATPDDDDATPDDDDATSDDDDATSDDDDATSDDDDATGDDDDVTPGDPGEAMVDQTYCIDWDSADITDPPDIAGLLSGAGITLSDYPLLLSPTAVDVPGGTIDMLGATASPTTCTQDMTMSTLPLTDTTPGSWAPPHFVVGPTDMALNIPSVGLLVIEGAILEGDFTGDAQQIVNGSMDGFINVGSLPGACFLLTCATCPSGVGDCAVFAFANATWDNNGMGALTPIP